MRRITYSSATGIMTAAAVVGLFAVGCGSSSESGTATETQTVAVSPTSAPTGAPDTTTDGGGAPDLQSLIPTPADTQRTDGPDSVQDSGVHMHFEVNSAPSATMDAYKRALEGMGWALTVQDSGGGHGGGGATYTGTNNDAYGVFTGGGYGSRTDIDACVWPTKPSKTHCGDHDGD